MYHNISYTAAYAEMTRCILQGIDASNQRDMAVAIRNFEHASQLAESANLGPEALVGTKRNLASAYRLNGRLADAERVFRDLLALPDLSEADRPHVMHELGMTLAQEGSPEATAILTEALALYTEHEYVLLCGIDLAEYWLAKGEFSRGCRLLLELIRPEDATEHPERFCHAHLTLVRCALALGQIHQASSHLETAQSALPAVKEPILHSLFLAVEAEREYVEGQRTAAEAHSIAALEQGLTTAEEDTGEVLRSVASIFLKVHGQSRT